MLSARSSGRRYRVSLSIPEGEPPPGGFPVMVVLDGAALFPIVAQTERRLAHRPDATGVRPTVIVGVGHDGDGLYDPDQRHGDFTFGPAAADDEASRFETGGAGLFLDFLLDDVLPLVSEQAPLSASSRALVGHSLAGSFALRVLTDRPAAFSAYAAISPSIWWDPAGLEKQFSRLTDPSPRLFLAAGALERAPAGSPKAARRMVEAVEELAKTASMAGLTDVVLNVFPDEDHASVVSVAATRFLRFAGRSGD